MSIPKKTIFEFTVNDVNGNAVSLEQVYHNKICVIVNISETSKNSAQSLRTLYLACSAYVDKNVKLLLFPCFQFGQTENVADLIEFVKDTCPGVGDLFEPIDVNGEKTSELYKFLKKQQPGTTRGLIMANFTVFIMDRQGVPWQRMNPGFSVDKLKNQLETCLKFRPTNKEI